MISQISVTHSWSLQLVKGELRGEYFDILTTKCIRASFAREENRLPSYFASRSRHTVRVELPRRHSPFILTFTSRKTISLETVDRPFRRITIGKKTIFIPGMLHCSPFKQRLSLWRFYHYRADRTIKLQFKVHKRVISDHFKACVAIYLIITHSITT